MATYNIQKWKDFRLALLVEQDNDNSKKKSVKADKDKATHIQVSKGKSNPNIKVYKEEEVEEAKPTKSEPLRYEEVVKIGEYQFAFGKDSDENIRVSFRSTNNFSADVIKKLCAELNKREEADKDDTQFANKVKKQS